MRERLARLLRAAPVSAALAVVLVVAYLVSAGRAGTAWEIPAEALLRDGASYAPALAAGEWWRVVTAAFLHGGVLHLLINLVVFADSAPLVEVGVVAGGSPPRLSARLLRVVGIFSLAAAGGFVASAWWSAESVSIGASGGILGFYGYWLARAWRAGGPRAASPLPVPPPPGRRRIALAAAYLVAAVLAGFLIPGIDNAAHLGGLFAGALLGSLPLGRAGGAGIGALVASLIVALAALPMDLADDYRAQQRFEFVYGRFVDNDRQANAELQRLLSELRAGRSAAAVADELEQLVTGRLRENRALWGDQAVADRHRTLAAEHRRWQRYGELRVAAAEALVEAMRAEDGAAQQRAMRRFEQAMRGARAIADGASDSGGLP